MTYKFSFSTLLSIVVITKLQGQQKAKRDATTVTAIAIDIK